MSKEKKETAPEAEEEMKAGQPETETEQTAASDAETEKAEEKKAETADEATTEEKKPADQKPEEQGPAVKQSEGLAALNDRYLRLCAEYDNYRRRSQKERDALYGDVRANTLREFLPVYDNLIRALAQPTGDEAYKKGVEMIMTQFRNVMEKLGVTEMDCLGKTFDPAFHNAVMHVDDPEKGDNEIVEVFQQGFVMGDRIVRHAMVKVAN